MNICLFTEDEIVKPLPLHDERSKHIIKILHKKTGDTFAAGIIGGKAGRAKITGIDEKKAACTGELRFSFTPETEGKPLHPLVLIIGFPRPIQLKRLLRDVAGLGACAVHLTGTELGEKSYLQSTLVERGAAYKMLLDGTMQAGSTHVPELYMHKMLSDCLQSVETNMAQNNMSELAKNAGGAQPSVERRNRTTGKIKIALDNAASERLAAFLKKNVHNAFPNTESTLLRTTVVAAIGSERGWTDSERALLEQHEYARCSMGARIFRTETAATVASSIILAYLGHI